jgi:ferrochelatase
VVGLPVYPMCGHSTTVAALQQLRDAVAAEDGWDPDVFELSG